MKVVKTYKGKSSNQLLKNAKVAETKDGTREIFAGDFLVTMVDSETVVLECMGCDPFAMTLGKRALDKMEKLTLETEMLFIIKHGL